MFDRSKVAMQLDLAEKSSKVESELSVAPQRQFGLIEFAFLPLLIRAWRACVSYSSSNSSTDCPQLPGFPSAKCPKNLPKLPHSALLHLVTTRGAF